MRVAVCDTNPMISEVVQRLLSEDLTARGETCVFENYTGGLPLVDAVASSAAYDIIFLNAQMRGQNGINITCEIKKYRPECMVVLYATTEEYAVAAFNVDAFFYLLLPTTKSDVSRILDRAMERINSMDSAFLRIKLKDGWYHILYRNILYIQSEAHKVIITLANREEIAAYGKLDAFEEVLSESKRFIRIHKSVLIQGMYVKKFSSADVICLDGTVFNVSRTLQDRARKQYDDYIARQTVITME